jgi:sigma-E factor negative regulatory protein RseC
MNELRATVLAGGAGKVRLRVEDRPGGCGRCDQPGGCRSTRLAHLFQAKPGEVEVDAPAAGVRLSTGDRVILTVADGGPLAAALGSYGLPLAGLLIGAAVASLLAPFANPDANAITGAVPGLFAGLFGVRFLMRSRALRKLTAVALRLDPGVPGHEETPCGKATGR